MVFTVPPLTLSTIPTWSIVPLFPQSKKNNVSCRRGITGVPEPAFTFKPLHTVRTKREFRNDSTLNITALRRKWQEHQYYKAMKDDMSFQISRARQRGIPLDSVHFDSQGNMRYNNSGDIVG